MATPRYVSPVLDHLEHGLQHADDGAVRAVLAFVEPAQAVEVTEELVGAVDEVNDHFGSLWSEISKKNALEIGLKQKAKELLKSGADVYV